MQTALADLKKDVSSPSSITKQKVALTNEFIKYSIPQVPKGKTNKLRSSIPQNSKPQQGLVRAYTPYANYINEGVSKSGKPLNYTEEGTGDRFFEETFEKHKDNLADVYAGIVNKQI